MAIGQEAFEKLRRSSVLVVGLGGVGAYAAEMICRAGVGTMTIVDGDVVHQSNRNRAAIGTPQQRRSVEGCPDGRAAPRYKS